MLDKNILYLIKFPSTDHIYFCFIICELFSIPWTIFVGHIFWTATDSGRYSHTVKRMLKVRLLVSNLMRCNINDGKSVSFWYDWWTDLRPLINMFGQRDPRELRVPIDSMVCNAVRNGAWSLPHSRSDEAGTLQVVLSTMEVPSDTRGSDRFLWRNGPCSYQPKCSSKETCNFIRQIYPKVPCMVKSYLVQGGNI